MPSKRAEIRRAHRAAWMQWRPANDEVGDRRVVAPPCDWPGESRRERRASWREAWKIWLEETVRAQRTAKEAA